MPDFTLTARECMLVSEALYRLDADTLNDDLVDQTDGSELDALANRFAEFADPLA